MKGLLLIVLILGFGISWLYLSPTEPSGPASYTAEEQATSSAQNTDEETDEAPLTEVVGTNLSVPWEVLFLPDGELLVTERPGDLILLKQGIEIPISGVRQAGEGGLLGAALHPDFAENNLIYLYHTVETNEGLRNQVVRYRLEDTELSESELIIENLPGARYHDGGRIDFGPDGYLYVTVGDAGNEADSQDAQNLAGSILRYTDEGNVPDGNPFDNPVYSYGHRNPQGLTWDENNNLWTIDHGRSGLQSGFDELNFVTAGGNYGWPNSEGDEVLSGTEGPVRHSGADTTWAPADLVYHNGSLYFTGLRGETLYRAVIDGNEIVDWYEYFEGEYGRLRAVNVGPDGLLYVTTSNRDGRGTLADTDDRIIRINPDKLPI